MLPKMGLSENRVNIPNEIAILKRDNDQQNHWENGVHNIFRHTHIIPLTGRGDLPIAGPSC